MASKALAAIQLAFIANVKLLFNGLSDVQVAAKGYLDKLFTDWPNQAFDVGVNDAGIVVGACPSGRGNEQAGAELRRQAVEAGATARNPITVGARGNITRTIAHFKRLLGDPTGETTARITTAELFTHEVAITTQAYIEALQAEIRAAQQARDYLATQVADWTDRGGIEGLSFAPKHWDPGTANLKTLPGLALPPANNSPADEFDWDTYLCDQVGMNREQILQFLDTVEADTQAYIDSRKRPAEQPNAPAVVNMRRM